MIPDRRRLDVIMVTLPIKKIPRQAFFRRVSLSITVDYSKLSLPLRLTGRFKYVKCDG
jgi:hypothetical protein